METNGAEQDRTEDQWVLSVEVVPYLPVAVERATAIDIDIFAAELEEGRRILECLVKAVGLPIVCVVCKLDCALDLNVDVL